MFFYIKYIFQKETNIEMSIKRETEEVFYLDPTLGLQDKLGVEFGTLEKALELVEKYGTMKDAVLDAEIAEFKLWKNMQNEVSVLKDELVVKHQWLEEMEYAIEEKIMEGEDITKDDIKYKRVYNQMMRMEKQKDELKNKFEKILENARFETSRRYKLESWLKNYK